MHAQAGPELRRLLDEACAGSAGDAVRCKEGDFVVTPGCGQLRHFNWIAHTVAPFWPTSTEASASSEWETLLRSCYRRSLENLMGRAERAEGVGGVQVPPLLHRN